LSITSANEIEAIRRSFALARAGKPAYADLYSLLEPLFLLQADARKSLQLAPVELSVELVETKWKEGFPLLRRWDFPIDAAVAENLLARFKEHIPSGNSRMNAAHLKLSDALASFPDSKEDIWHSFLHHEGEPWQEWIAIDEADIASLLFLARNCLRPSIEWTADGLSRRFPLPKDWLRGYCPLCGSLPALLYLEGEGERKAHCSWCATHWELHRLQCPYCDNRHHESLGYLSIEAEPHYRAQYCRICKSYFKLIDTREMLDPPYYPLEEWTTLHLDLLARQAGWQQPPSPSPVVYGEEPQ
jgi:FdhE protein